MNRVITIILLFVTLIISACSNFPAEKSMVGSFTSEEGLTFQTLVEYQHADTEELFSADEFAFMAHLVTEEWKADPNLSFPSRMETCLSETHHIIVDDATFVDLCDSDDFEACHYTRKTFKVGEGYKSPYDSVSIYRESLFSADSCYALSSLIAHEFMHKMEECHRDQGVRDNGDRDHEDDYLWYRHSEWESFEFRASESIATTMEHPVCGYPLTPVL